MKALMVIPMPCEGRLFFKVSTAVAKRWEADNPGKTMTMDHFETRRGEYGLVTVIWDAPQPAASAANEADPHCVYPDGLCTCGEPEGHRDPANHQAAPVTGSSARGA